MTTTVPTRTITEVKSISRENLLIQCLPSLQDDGTNNPEIYRSSVLEVPSSIDNVNGIEGELILSTEDKSSGKIDNNGELIISVNEDNPDKYSVDKTKGNLNYAE